MLIDAVGIIRARLDAMYLESRDAAEAARLAGESQMRALNANALKQLRISSILPSLPDNDRLHDRLRVLRGQPSELMCPLPKPEDQ